ncbi:hypothetical protein [Scleromatobacter humisilvae]|uniref:DUF4148 domain-containing protein n=1 Tax=Scleromatobacter humisilvae TaxID=2897159 RepID=A0A9X1YHX5_9BURK|nr:hypothetical protein [Scleromatobacter humisilvae]MCK9686468.1 hypothetical protein [Scleromatobacter humisilvae]
MKSTLLVSAVALAATAFAISAQAQTGRPSAIEVQASSDAPRTVATDEEAGSYARYLMLNGATRDEALAAARNVDHPVVRSRLAAKGRAPADAKAPVRQ